MLAWGFEWNEELPPGYCSRVFASEDRVLKVPWQGEEMVTGGRAARLIEPWGPIVFEVHEPTGIVLMERLRPGTSLLSAMPVPGAENLFCGWFRAMADLPTGGLMPVESYYSNQVLPEPWPERRFLHGDLHHENILRHGDAWKVIDPKGLEGDPHFECVAWVRNAALIHPHGMAQGVTETIQSLCDKLNLDPQRLLHWCWIDSRENAEGDPISRWTQLAGVIDSLWRDATA